MTSGIDNLNPRYKSALDRTVSYLLGRYDVIGIIATGTIVRGHGHPSSDLDVVVGHDATWRQRIQRLEGDVPIEVFVNPVPRLRAEFANDCASGRPIMIGMIATGVAVHDPTGAMATLQAEARDAWNAGPSHSTEQLTALRYGIATEFEDAVDIANEDAERAGELASSTLLRTLRYSFTANGDWVPREKALLVAVERQNPDLGARVRMALRAPMPERLHLIETIVGQILGVTGFFAWESAPQEVP
jgi:hypothetical protein